MYIKRYTAAAFLLMILTGWYVYAFVSHESMGLDLFGIHLPAFPIALWVVVPLFLLYLASVVHMSYYSLVGSFHLRRYTKDFEKFAEALRDALLGKKNRHSEYKTERYATLGKVLDHCRIVPDTALSESGNEEIDGALKLLRDIEAGEHVDIRRFHLENDNPLVVKYHRNRFARGEVIAEDILSKPERYSRELAVEAYKSYVKDASLASIVKYKQYMSRDALEMILRRMNAKENGIEPDTEVLIDLIGQIEVSEDDFICGSIILAQTMLPQQRITLFEKLSDVNEDAMAAYIYTLYDLEVVEEANNLLDGARSDEYLQFRAYRALKEANKNYSINLFTPKVCR